MRRGRAEERDALPATLRGSIVHLLLERLDFAAPEAPVREEVAELIESFGEPVREPEVDDLCDMVERFAASELRERIAAAETVRTELPFVFTLETEGRSLLVNGVVDVHAVETTGGLLVVDYKSNRLEGRTPAEITESDYTTQRLVYALAALRSGAPEVEVAYVFLERPEEPVVRAFAQADDPRARARAPRARRRRDGRALRAHRCPASRAVRRLPGPRGALLLGAGPHAGSRRTRVIPPRPLRWRGMERGNIR